MMASTKQLKKRVELLSSTVKVLVANHAFLSDVAKWLVAESRYLASDAEKRMARAVVDARVANASLATIRARVSQAEREGLLQHQGQWPWEVVDAVARRAYGWPEPFEIEGIMRMRAMSMLDAAARAYREHGGPVGTITSGLTYCTANLDAVADAVGTTDPEAGDPR